MPRLAAALAAFTLAGCLCASPAPGALFRCDQGQCPSGLVCSGDDVCVPDPAATDGGSGGGAAGGAGGGAAGGAGGGAAGGTGGGAAGGAGGGAAGGAGGGAAGGAGGGAAGGAGGGAANVLPYVCPQAWCWEHPLPFGRARVNDLHAFGSNAAWLVGDNGLLFAITGGAYREYGSPHNGDFNAVWASSLTDVRATGDFGDLVYLDGGRFFQGYPSGFGSTEHFAMDGPSNAELFTGGYSYQLVAIDGGDLRQLQYDAGGPTYYAIAARYPGRGIAAGDAVTALAGGIPVPLPKPTTSTLYAAWMPAPDEALIAGGGGALYRSTLAAQSDGGVAVSWAPVNSGTTSTIYALWGWDGGEVVHGGSTGLYSVVGGVPTQVSASFAPVSALAGVGPATLFATTYDGRVARRATTSGPFLDHKLQTAAFDAGLRSVSLLGDGTAFAVGDGHFAARRSPAGTWSPVAVSGGSASGVFQEVLAFDAGRAVAVGSSPLRFAVLDTQLSPAFQTSGYSVSQDLKAVWGTSPTDLWIGGANGYLARLTGTTLTTYPLPRTITVEGIWGTSTTDFYVVGEGLTVLHYSGGSFAVEYEQADGGALYDVEGFSASEVWAVGQSGVVLRLGAAADGGWGQEARLGYDAYAIAAANGRLMVTGNTGRTYLGPGWTRVAMPVEDAMVLEGVGGAPGAGFLAVGRDGTVMRWAP